jgi:RNA polymerase sigma factor (sigma-70 family)
VSRDLELLDRWRSGDSKAGSELLRRQFDLLYGFFRTKADPGVVPELVQQTLVACIESRDRFRGEAGFSTYLYAIARSVLVAHYRRHAREGVPFDPAVSSVDDAGPRLSDAFVAREQQRLLLRGLRALPLDHQVLLELHYWERLSGSALAEVLEIPEGTVRTRLRRAKQLLRDAVLAAEATPGAAATTMQDLDGWAESLRDAVRSSRGGSHAGSP